jgi:zinc transport system permease protein
MAVTIVIAIKLIGIVLVSALLVLPGATGRQLVSNYRGMMAYSIVVGVLSTVLGLLLSYHLNLASGATIVLLAGILFFIAFLYSRVRKR